MNNLAKFFSLNIQSRIFYYLGEIKEIFPIYTTQDENVLYYLATLGTGALLDIMLLLRHQFKKKNLRIRTKNNQAKFISSFNPKIKKIIVSLLRMNYSSEEIDLLINLPPEKSLRLQSYPGDEFAEFKNLKALQYQERIDIFWHSPLVIKNSSQNCLNCQSYSFIMYLSELEDFCSNYNFTYKGILDSNTAWFLSKNNIPIFVKSNFKEEAKV